MVANAPGRETCGSIIETFVRALRERPDLPPVQIIGGNGAAALRHAKTAIDLESRTITAPAVCDLPRLRSDGSVRDLDTLVLSTDPVRIETVRLLGENVVGHRLPVSVFGLKPLSDLNEQRRRPWRSTARIFLADRYVTPDAVNPWTGEQNGPISFEGYKALYPFQAPIGNETMETFQLLLDGRPAMPTSHPGATILSYLTRSISGLRAKDAAKVVAMVDNVVTRYPEIGGWMRDGPGRDLFDLARILHTLREPRRHPQPLRLGAGLEVRPYRLGELREHPGLMATEQSRGPAHLIIEVSHIKSSVLGHLEGNPAIVGFWRKHLEDRVAGVIHNEP